MDHNTWDLENLPIYDKYNGGDDIHATNGLGMAISHVEKSTTHIPSHNIWLNNILHVPRTTKILFLLHHLASHTNVLLGFCPNFSDKGLEHEDTLLRGQCHNGLYHLPSSLSATKHIHGANKTSFDIWHHRFGHLMFPIAYKDIRGHSILCQVLSNNRSMCDAC